MRMASVGASFLLVGILPGTVEAADEDGQRVDATLDYVCTLPSGTYDAKVDVSATLPRSVSRGEHIKPADVALDATLPAPALASADDAAEQGTRSQTVSGTADLDVALVQQGNAAKATHAAWAGLTIPDTPLPDTGEVELSAKGPAPWVSAGSNGNLTFTAGDVDLALTTHRSEGDGTESGSAEDPSVEVKCSLAHGQDAVLAIVAVGSTPQGRGGASPGRPEGASPPAKSPRAQDSPVPDRAAPKASTSLLDPGDYCTVLLETPFPPPILGHGWVAGYANVNKLDGAVFLKDPAQLVEVNPLKRFDILTCRPPFNTIRNRVVVEAKLKDQKFPPAEATLLTFGFVPTSATVELTLDAPIDIKTYPFDTYNEVSVVDSKVWIRVRDVTVNGVKLDVGSTCRTVRPMDQELIANGGYEFIPGQGRGDPFGYTVLFGGPIGGYSDVPPFSGCGTHGEDLSNILTASLSGPGNFTKLTQGALCIPNGGQSQKNCPNPPKPVPER